MATPLGTTSAPVPPLWPYTVRPLPRDRQMPLRAVSVAPSRRIRFTSPVIVRRLASVTSSLTTYHLEVVSRRNVSSYATAAAVALTLLPFTV